MKVELHPNTIITIKTNYYIIKKMFILWLDNYCSNKDMSEFSNKQILLLESISRKLGNSVLNDWSLERWLEDFDYRVEEVMSCPMIEEETIVEYMNSLNWNVEYENN